MKSGRKRRERGWPRTVSCGNAKVKVYRVAYATGYVAFQVANYGLGRRRLESFADEREALRRAEQVARQLSAGETTAASFCNSDAAAFGRAVELLRPSGVPLEIAAASFAKAFEILGGDSVVEAARFYSRHQPDHVENRSVAETVSELIDSKAARGKSARYLADLRSRLKRFAEAFAVDISTVTTSDVQRWLDGRKVSAQTAKNFRTVLFTLFEFAEARGYIFKGGNPVAGTESISVVGGEISIYSAAEIAALLAAASVNYAPLLALGAFAGLRAAEAERLEWNEIDLDGAYIHVASHKSKTRSRRLVPIPGNLGEWLRPHVKPAGKVWPGSLAGLRSARLGVVAAAGVAWKPNALRHSYISYRLAIIQNAAQVALEAGNSPGVVFRHYRELVRPAEAEAWFSVCPPANYGRHSNSKGDL